MKRDTALKYIADKNIKDDLVKEATGLNAVEIKLETEQIEGKAVFIGKNYLEQETERLEKLEKTKTKGGLSEELNPPSIFSQLGGK
jgi:hypothetical protein